MLFADVRGFTTLSEQLSPEQMVYLLNEYLDVIADAVEEFGGVINQYQGDNMMVMFNASTPQPDHAQKAVQTGLALQQAVAHYHAQNLPAAAQLEFGVGVNSGPALVGNIGAHRHYNFTVIGDTVNLAARITGAAPPGEVWFSQTTREQLGHDIAVEPLPPLTFKGKSQPTPLFRALWRS
ncbi:MAG: adenylate/guanylate cyclase domain-containing protein [Anaerolineae bacterium]